MSPCGAALLALCLAERPAEAVRGPVVRCCSSGASTAAPPSHVPWSEAACSSPKRGRTRRLAASSAYDGVSASPVEATWRVSLPSAVRPAKPPDAVPSSAIARLRVSACTTVRFRQARAECRQARDESSAGGTGSVNVVGSRGSRLDHSARPSGAVGAAGRGARAAQGARHGDRRVASGEDVGEQIVDVEARLSNARNTEQRLVDLLQRRTGKLEQVLAAEREMPGCARRSNGSSPQRKRLERPCHLRSADARGQREDRQATVNLGPEPVYVRCSRRFRQAALTGR